MNKYNIFLTIIILLFLYSCATPKAKYKQGEPQTNFNYPVHKEIEKSFYLLGDAGYSQSGETSEGLLALKAYLSEVKQKGNYTLFLGDNIYPDGMPPKDDPKREQAEYRLDVQLDALKDYDGNIVVIPGNHDWYNKGIKGVKEEAKYFENSTEQSVEFAPKPGCGLKSISISDKIQLLVLDSQWYLTNWDKNPLINDNCPEIKTREALFREVDKELKKNQNKTVIFALHHPLYSNGVHGGKYNFNQHLYPSKNKIPLPILGSLAMLIRTTGGVSIQDAQNERYKSLVKRLETISKSWGNVIFVSGHEHTLQYIEHEHIKQVISGAGSKKTYAGLRNDGFFAYSGQGFAVLDLFKDGSSWISYYGSVEHKPKLLYQKEVFPAAAKPKKIDFPESYPQTVMASVYKPSETKKREVYTSIWGDRYRKLYSTPIKVAVAQLDTLFGGLEVMRTGGGHQTRSLRFKDSLGREYNLRAIKKNAVQLLQTVAYKDTPIESDLEQTLPERIIQDFYTASHPYGFLAIPTLSEAADVYHTNPKLIYVPKQKTLGKYNEAYGDDLYMIVQRPEEHWVGSKIFGSPNHDIRSTRGLFKRLRRDEKYVLDEPAYIRARIFDMLVGDWDRHQDQWRWAETKNEEGTHIFEPIARDRDQVFSNFDGVLFTTLRIFGGFIDQFGKYGKDISDLRWFNKAALGLDRRLLQNEGRESWIAQAEYIQEHVSDEVIEEAFSKLPKETQGESSEKIIESLKGRRDNIVDIAKRYYDILAEIAIITGTDKDDIIEVERQNDGQTQVSLYRNKKGEKADLVSQKTYSPKYTREIWVYGLNDDDIFKVYGPGKKAIRMRIIGGQNNDIYRIENGKNLRVYDHKSLPNTIEENKGARIIRTDNYEVNVFDKDRTISNTNSLLPQVGYNPDDGIRLGLREVYTSNGFRRNPFTVQHKLQVGYYFHTQSFDAEYQGEFTNVRGNYNLAIGAHYASPNYTRNFFGFGNETENPEDELTRDYNRMRISDVGAEIGLVRKSPYGSYFKYAASFDGIQVQSTANRFLWEEFSQDPEFYKRKYFAGVEANYRYESYDYLLNPTQGMKFELSLGAKTNTAHTSRTFGNLHSYLEFYNAISRNRKWVLNSRIRTDINIGNKYEFYQAATLGGNTGLRGYRKERFSGQGTISAGADLRYGFPQFKTRFLPFQVGVFGGYDIGKVWVSQQDSKIWHDSYGGGIWVTGAKAVSGTLNLFTADEGIRVSAAFRFRFLNW